MKSKMTITIDVSSKGYGVPGKLPDQINKLFLDAGWNVDRLEIDNTSADTLVPVEAPKFLRTYKSKPPSRKRWVTR